MSKTINTWVSRIRRACERVSGLKVIKPWPDQAWPCWSVW